MLQSKAAVGGNTFLQKNNKMSLEGKNCDFFTGFVDFFQFFKEALSK
jgi:hypothetical protein